MCGIAGVLLDGDRVVDARLLERMAASLSHRGPDHQAEVVRGSAGFAHTRLSILDVSPAGHQPMADSRFVLSYNGEIYNYQELRRRLKARGVEFASGSDTEVLFRHLIHFGVAATLPLLRGMFAFGFYDAETETLYLCRDRLGIKPLSFLRRGGDLYWASEVKALRQAVAVAPDSLKTLLSMAGFGESSGRYTVFEGVDQVAPGSYLECLAGQTPREHRYFQLLDLIDQEVYRELASLPEIEVMGRFDELVRTSVESMLMADVPVGVFVSGGIDSSLVAAVASQRHPDLALFTANTKGPYSELAAAEELAQTLGRPLHVYDYEPEYMLRDWVHATLHYECPIVYFTNAVAFSGVAALARDRGVKAVLTGEGSDELFVGYPGSIYQSFFKYLRLPVELVKGLYGVWPRLKGKLFPKPSADLGSFLLSISHGYDSRRASDDALEAYSFLPRRECRYQAQAIPNLSYQLLALLHRNDRMGMMASIESRFPYLDEALLAFALNLPLRWKLRRSLHFHNYKHPFHIDKLVVRKLADRFLPQSLTRRPKWGFLTHAFDAMRVDERFFHGGYVEQVLRLTRRDLAELVQRESRNFVARLVSVDIFGRLFGLGLERELVEGQLRRHVHLDLH